MPRAKATPKQADDSDDAPLKRLGGGRWQTRDERFTIEPQSGTWAVVDAEQTDDFGMPLVRGPYPSLTDAKAAISEARTSGPAESPLSRRIAERASRPKAERASAPANAADTAAGAPKKSARGRAATEQGTAAARDQESKPARPAARGGPDQPKEPAWLTDLNAPERGKARRLIARLEEAGVDDAAGIVRRDILGDVPAVATVALRRRLADLGEDATPAEVASLLADGRDEPLDVRWRLVDGQGRPIVLDQGRGRR